MTEDLWQSCFHIEHMLLLVKGVASDRKYRLFMVACARRLLPDKADGPLRNAIDCAEMYSDGKCTKRELAACRSKLGESHSERSEKWNPLFSSHIRSVPAWHATREAIVRGTIEGYDCCLHARERIRTTTENFQTEYRAQSKLILDIFGNPFRPITFAPAWQTLAAVALAQTMYDARDFAAMPILADALEDAGCDHPDVLAHCRGPGPHVRGCWVVDLVLGKS